MMRRGGQLCPFGRLAHVADSHRNQLEMSRVPPTEASQSDMHSEAVPAELVSGDSSRWEKSSPIIRADTMEHPIEGAWQFPPCNSCGAPQDGANAYCTSCGVPLSSAQAAIVVSGRSGADQTALPDRVMQCKGCGAEVATSFEQRSFVCPFCDTATVVELPVSEGRQRPEFIIGFSVTAEQAKEKFFQWLGQNAWYRPGDLAFRAVAEKQRGVYLPFWHFSMFAESRWSAQIGEYWYRTETYKVKDSQGKTQTRTRQVRETEWFPLHGQHHRYYYGFLVPATRGISLEESHAIQPFQLDSLQRFRPFFLAGWMAEEYSVDRDEAAKQTVEEFRRRQEREITQFLPGDTHRSLQVHTDVELNDSDLILLPVHVLSYRYRDSVYHFLVNGQTGKVVGQKPWSGRRVTALILTITALIALVVVAIAYLSNR